MIITSQKINGISEKIKQITKLAKFPFVFPMPVLNSCTHFLPISVRFDCLLCRVCRTKSVFIVRLRWNFATIERKSYKRITYAITLNGMFVFQLRISIMGWYVDLYFCPQSLKAILEIIIWEKVVSPDHVCLNIILTDIFLKNNLWKKTFVASHINICESEGLIFYTCILKNYSKSLYNKVFLNDQSFGVYILISLEEKIWKKKIFYAHRS